jgi:hypothetical protein
VTPEISSDEPNGTAWRLLVELKDDMLNVVDEVGTTQLEVGEAFTAKGRIIKAPTSVLSFIAAAGARGQGTPETSSV